MIKAKDTVSWFRKIRHIFPALYGLLIYISIRLVNDVVSETRFWERPWQTNIAELIVSVAVSYPFVWVCRYYLRRVTKYQIHRFCERIVIREFLFFLLSLQGLVIGLLFPLAAFTDDGLQWYDVINLSLIPILFWVLYFTLALGNMLVRRNYEQQLQLQKVNNDKLQAELRLLKAQFHPHFLFNALNTVYFQIEEKNIEAKYTLEKLSELLRYQLYDRDEKVLLSDELSYLRSYIELQRQRMNEHLKLEVNMKGEVNGQLIYPMLMLPLVENAFKYVGGRYRITISGCITEEKQLHMTVENTIPVPLPQSNKNRGIGLENLRRRLELLYPNGHSFANMQNDGIYTASLTIKL